MLLRASRTKRGFGKKFGLNEWEEGVAWKGRQGRRGKRRGDEIRGGKVGGHREGKKGRE